MVSLFLQFVAVSEYLFASSIPAIIACTALNAVAHMIQGIDSLFYFQWLLILLSFEKAIVGVSYKLQRPKDNFVYEMMRVCYAFIILLQIYMIYNINNQSKILFLELFFLLKNVFFLMFLCVRYVLVSVPEFSNQILEYRFLASRLYQFWDYKIGVVFEDSEEQEKQEVVAEKEDEKEGQEEKEKQEEQEIEEEEEEKEGQKGKAAETEGHEEQKGEVAEKEEEEEEGEEEVEVADIEEEEDMDDAESEEKEAKTLISNFYEADVDEFLNQMKQKSQL